MAVGLRRCKALDWCGCVITDKIKNRSQTILQGPVAQLGERIVRNDEVVGSIPTSSTNIYAGSFDLAQDFGRELACLLRRLD